MFYILSAFVSRTTMSNTAITYTQYHDERQLASIMDLIDTELSEPYINMTYRYFVHTWCVVCG